jgi:tRNA-uridine 2-sulfurtransferase
MRLGGNLVQLCTKSGTDPGPIVFRNLVWPSGRGSVPVFVQSRLALPERQTMTRRVVLAMSGGVDSSAAAVLLKRQGYDVIGLFMRSGVTEEAVCATSGSSLPIIASTGESSQAQAATRPGHKQGCCSASDAADARRVADLLDIPFYALNFSEAFGRIKDYFADEYLSGRTPNPCVMCNNWLKFGKLWEFARQVDADAIATGHYAQLRDIPEEDRPALVRGADSSKDQSYVLFGIARELLNRVIFPVGSFDKPAIRELAREAGLRVADKPDSQEICFIPDNDYAGFLRKYRGLEDLSGEFVDTVGTVLGRHEGCHNFTIGQRRGLGIALGSPRFVVAIEPETRRVVLGTHDDLARHELEADRLNWLVPNLPARFRCRAQIRYRHEAAETEIHVEPDRIHVQFAEPQYGVTPGQAVVLYDGDRVLGGGWIR